MGSDKMFIMNGELISLSDFGNLNYGYTGIVIGFGPKALFSGGGWAATGSLEASAPLYGDSQVDHMFIERGINMALKDSLGLQGGMFDGDVRLGIKAFSNFLNASEVMQFK